MAIERPDGRLVDALLQAGHPVVPVSLNAIKAWRDGEVVSGAKSDARRRTGHCRVPAAASAQAARCCPVQRRDQGPAHRGPQSHRPGRDAGGRDQPTDRATGHALARPHGHLRRRRVAEVLHLGNELFYPLLRDEEIDVTRYGSGKGMHFGTVSRPGPSDHVGTLTIYDDGYAHYVSHSGQEIWLIDESPTYNWLC